MNKYQIAKLDSYKLVIQIARNDKPTTDSIPSFAKSIDRLVVIINLLDSIKVGQEEDITGIADDKDHVQEELCDYLLDIAGAIYSYAHAKKDLTLMPKIDIKPGTIEKFMQADIITACDSVKKEASKVPAADLAKEGVSGKDLETFSKLLDDYKKVKPTPREAILVRSTQTVNIKELFSEARDLIKCSLDRLAPQFKRKNPDYYLKYKAARNIIYPKANNKSGSKTTNLV